MTMERESFAERLGLIMRATGMTRTQLADKLHITEQVVRDYLDGRQKPRITTLITMCDTLDVSADWLIGRTNIPDDMTSAYQLIHDNPEAYTPAQRFELDQALRKAGLC